MPPKKSWRLLVIVDYSLRGTEVDIFRPDNLFTAVCCLQNTVWAGIWDVINRLPSLLKDEDYHSLLLFHVGSNDAVTKRFQNTKRFFMGLRKMLKESGAHSIFCLPKWGTGTQAELDKWIGWMTRPVPVRGFGFFDLGHISERPGMPADGAHLTKLGMSVLGSKLARLINRALN